MRAGQDTSCVSCTEKVVLHCIWSYGYWVSRGSKNIVVAGLGWDIGGYRCLARHRHFALSPYRCCIRLSIAWRGESAWNEWIECFDIRS